MLNKNKILKEFNKKVLSCKRCPEEANKNVGFGNIESSLMFVAQNPRVIKPPDNQILIYPFDLDSSPTKSGKFLLRLIRTLELEDKYYLTNIMKCSTPKNREPNKQEMKMCAPYWKFEVQLQRPKVIIFLGKPAEQFYILFGCDILKECGLDPKIYNLWHPSYFCYQPNKINRWLELAEMIKEDIHSVLDR